MATRLGASGAAAVDGVDDAVMDDRDRRLPATRCAWAERPQRTRRDDRERHQQPHRTHSIAAVRQRVARARGGARPRAVTYSRHSCVPSTSSARKRDGGALSRDEIEAVRRAASPTASLAGLPDLGAADGDRPARHDRRGDGRPDRGDGPFRRHASTCRDLPGLKVDKHSTGGVGDKTSLILAPLAAALRRGRADDVGPRPRPHRRHARQARIDPRLPRRPARSASSSAMLAEVGCGMIGQTAEIAPADKKLYALRDVTGDGREHPAHHRVDPEQEDRRGHRRAGARRQVRPRRVHEDAGDGAGARRVAGRDRQRDPASGPRRSSPRWTRRSAAPSATRSR